MTSATHGPAVRDARFATGIQQRIRELEALCLARGRGVEPPVSVERIDRERHAIGDEIKQYLARVRAGKA